MEKITLKVFIDAPLEKVWEMWTSPRHIAQWNRSNEDWHTPNLLNDLRAGGLFCFRMEAKDGSTGFEHSGRYDQVLKGAQIAYTLIDGRSVRNRFVQDGKGMMISETFDPEAVTPLEEQRKFCAAVLNSFKIYVESLHAITHLVGINSPPSSLI